LGLENTSGTMGIHDHVQELYRTYTFQIGVWPRSGGAIRISGTESVRSCNYQYVRKRYNIGEVKSIDGNGRKQDLGRISPRGTESKGKILA